MLGFLPIVIALAGCGSPSAANIELRKQNQTLQAKVDDLTAQHQRDVQTLAAAERSRPTTAQLPPDRLDSLVTTHGLSFGHLTGGDNPGNVSAADTELKIFVVPVDAEGTAIKAAGTFTVQAFDLEDPKKPLIGTWNFNLQQTRASFYDKLALYTYALECPFQTKPTHANLTIHITFDDALTGRQFVDQVQAKVRLTAEQP
jgi:outer membrane murein-binding lipoprotein Lpp